MFRYAIRSHFGNGQQRCQFKERSDCTSRTDACERVSSEAIVGTSFKHRCCRIEMQPFPQNPLPAPHRTTRSQIITGNYLLTTSHYWQITGIYMAFNIQDVYCYRQFTDKVVNERSEFFRGLSDKSEYERPMATLLRGLCLRDRGSDFHTVFTGV